MSFARNENPSGCPTIPVSPEGGVLIVIVNYRTGALTVDCLRSLETETRDLPDLRVTVTDCASGDDSVALIGGAIEREGWGGWARLIPLVQNGGFAYGNNAAIRPALESPDPPAYVILLNPDTVVRPGAIATLVDFMRRNPAVGLAGSRLEDPDGKPQRSAFRFHSPLGEFEEGLRLGVVSRLLRRWVVAPQVPDGARRADWVAGACLIVRREVFEREGLLDEGYFMYFEEVDFCKRAGAAGWECWYVPEARVVHLVGQSSGVTKKAATPRRRPAYWFRSRRRYFRAHHGAAGTLAADVAWAVGFGAFRARQLLLGTPSDDPPMLLRDFLRHNFLPGAR